MHPLSVILSIFFIIVCFASSAMDFQHNPRIVETMKRFHMPTNFELVAGIVKVLAALGLLAGLVRGHSHGSIIITTSICLTLYFFIAVVFHVRAKDKIADIGPAFILFLLAFVLAVG
jgi:hypothetical protein